MLSFETTLFNLSKLSIRVKINILAYNFFIWTELWRITSPIIMVQIIVTCNEHLDMKNYTARIPNYNKYIARYSKELKLHDYLEKVSFCV